MTTQRAYAERDLRGQAQARSRVMDAAQVLFRHRPATVGLVLLAIITAIAILAPVLAPHDPRQTHGRERLTAPGSLEYPLGADGLGRDVLSRLVFGARLSLMVGASVVIFSNLLGLAVGLTAGYYRRMDNVLMRVMDALMAFPPVLLALGIMAALGAAVTNTIVALGIVYTPLVARVSRSIVLGIRDAEYIVAARAVGLDDVRLLLRHILPNTLGPVIVQATFIFAFAVILEAALSFLGVGASPETPTWGNMLSHGRELMRVQASLTLFPGLAIMITVLSLNLLGDGLRDILDPHSYTR